eukprot:11191256-Lingulodinium_polyedra.AAC.1
MLAAPRGPAFAPRGPGRGRGQRGPGASTSLRTMAMRGAQSRSSWAASRPGPQLSQPRRIASSATSWQPPPRA